MNKVAVIGATGYTGIELVRILIQHPEIQISSLTSEKNAGSKFSEIFPAFTRKMDIVLEPFEPNKIASKTDIAFLCLPHKTAMDAAFQLRQKNVLVFDLSADFRLKDPEVYASWYETHHHPELLREAVYGLPELFREEIKKSDLIACPGCYPTSCALAIAPLLQSQLIETDSIIFDSKSGTSGAGRNASIDSLFCEVNEGFKAYKVGQHRHTPEIEQTLSRLSGKEIKVSFTPHLVPMDRGILTTGYAKPNQPVTTDQLIELYKKFYAQEPFVRIRDKNSFPNTKEVRGTNFCDISVMHDPRTNRIVVLSVIDNLTKGASGQAIQNLNIRMGWEETAGLSNLTAF